MAAVRIFVEDSLRPSTGALREVRFRGGNVVFVNGKNVTLAAANPRGTGAVRPTARRGFSGSLNARTAMP